MGNPRESLHTFIRNLERAPEEARDRAETQNENRFVTTIPTGRFDPSIGKIEVRGKMTPYVLAPTTYSAPDLGLHAAVFDVDGEHKPLAVPLDVFTASLKGDEVEVDTSRVCSETSFSTSFWDNWKELGAGEVYAQDIYPSVIRALRRLKLVENGRRIIAVDLFGGDGEFAAVAATSLAVNGQKPEMHIVDKNKKSLSKAKERFASRNHGKFVVHRPVDLAEADNIFPNLDARPNLVTAIGGLCQYVVTREQALRIARKVYEGMKNNGIFVATGFTEMRLNADDFREIGFSVERMSIPKNVVYLAKPHQLYVLRK